MISSIAYFDQLLKKMIIVGGRVHNNGFHFPIFLKDFSITYTVAVICMLSTFLTKKYYGKCIY